MHTIGFLDLQLKDDADRNFDKSWSVYTHMPFLTWSENQPGIPAAGNFITGMGGFLQSLINGYGGVRLHFDHLSISNFYVPPNSQSLEIKSLTYLNNRFSLNIIGRTATLKFLEINNEKPLILTLNPGNKHIPFAVGVAISFDREEELTMEPMIDTFGNCEMKKTVLGEKASAESVKISVVLISLALFVKSLIC